MELSCEGGVRNWESNVLFVGGFEFDMEGVNRWPILTTASKFPMCLLLGGIFILDNAHSNEAF